MLTISFDVTPIVVKIIIFIERVALYDLSVPPPLSEILLTPSESPISTFMDIVPSPLRRLLRLTQFQLLLFFRRLLLRKLLMYDLRHSVILPWWFISPFAP